MYTYIEYTYIYIHIYICVHMKIMNIAITLKDTPMFRPHVTPLLVSDPATRLPGSYPGIRRRGDWEMVQLRLMFCQILMLDARLNFVTVSSRLSETKHVDLVIFGDTSCINDTSGQGTGRLADQASPMTFSSGDRLPIFALQRLWFVSCIQWVLIYLNLSLVACHVPRPVHCLKMLCICTCQNS